MPRRHYSYGRDNLTLPWNGPFERTLPTRWPGGRAVRPFSPNPQKECLSVLVGIWKHFQPDRSDWQRQWRRGPSMERVLACVANLRERNRAREEIERNAKKPRFYGIPFAVDPSLSDGQVYFVNRNDTHPPEFAPLT